MVNRKCVECQTQIGNNVHIAVYGGAYKRPTRGYPVFVCMDCNTMLRLKNPTDPEVIEWLSRYTDEDTRFLRTARSLAEAVYCRVYRKKLGKEKTLLFIVAEKRIRLVVTDDTVDLIREEFLNWRDAIVFAKGVLAVHKQPYGGGMLTCQE